MNRKVFVTGMGIISAIGRSVEESLVSLNEKRTGIAPIKYLQSRWKDEFPAGEVKYSNKELQEILSLGGETHSRTFLLALHAAREALCGKVDYLDMCRTGIVSGSTVGGMDLTENYFQNVQRGLRADVSDLLQHDCGYATQRVAELVGIKGYLSTLSTACSSSANAIIHSVMLIRSGRLDAALAGGSDSLSRFTVNGFNTLKILDRSLCSPFDDNRNGLNLGEGSGFLLLESEESAAKHPSDIICEVSGFGNSCDAYHQTAMSDDGIGPKLCMNQALKSAGLQASDIDYINLHGTGTENNDRAEGTSIEAVYAGAIPAYSSTKSFTGHTLGAAGGIEAVISALALRYETLFPNINFKTRMKELSVDPVREVFSMPGISHVMSNSFGFGGNNSSLIFSKVR